VTPREVDVAFVLSGVHGVVEVRAMAPGDALDFAVQLDDTAASMPAAHYALLRVLTHEECRRVLFHALPLPASLAARSHRLDLTAEEREAAAERVPLTSAALEQTSPLPPPRATLPTRMPTPAAEGPPTALLVAANERLVATVQAALGPNGQCVRIDDVVEAVNRAFSVPFELLACAAPLAYGPGGLVTRIADVDPLGAGRVVVIADVADPRLASHLADRPKFLNPLLLTPADPSELARWVSREWPPPSWAEQLAEPRASRAGDARSAASEANDASQPAREGKPLCVLVIDDDPSTAAFVAQARDSKAYRLLFAEDGWSALDLATSDDFDLAICSATMRMPTGDLVYRFLWTVRPASKTRFVLLGDRVAATSIPPPSANRARLLVERPLTAAVLNELAAAHVSRRG